MTKLFEENMRKNQRLVENGSLAYLIGNYAKRNDPNYELDHIISGYDAELLEWTTNDAGVNHVVNLRYISKDHNRQKGSKSDLEVYKKRSDAWNTNKALLPYIF